MFIGYSRVRDDDGSVMHGTCNKPPAALVARSVDRGRCVRRVSERDGELFGKKPPRGTFVIEAHFDAHGFVVITKFYIYIQGGSF